MQIGKLSVVLTAATLLACQSNNDTDAGLQYPLAERGDQVDEYHGVSVPDPYRWMESDSPELSEWVGAQNALAEPLLAASGARQYFIERLTALWNYERIGTPRKYGDFYFYTHNDGEQDHDILYRSDAPGSAGVPVLDPNAFSEDATVALSRYTISQDGRYIAYASSDGGTDWVSWRVRDVQSGKDLTEVLKGSKFTSASWMPDNSGFYYSRYPLNAAGDYDDSQKVQVYFHNLGEPQSSDVLVYSLDDHPTRNPYAQVTKDGRFLLLSAFDGFAENGIRLLDLSKPGAEVRDLLYDWDGLYYYLGQDGDELFFRTTANAPRGRIVATNTRTLARRVVVEQRELAIDSATMVGKELIVSYLKDVKNRVYRYAVDGEFVAELSMPGDGTVSGFEDGADTSETFFKFTNHLTPGALYRLDLGSGNAALLRAPDSGFDADRFEQRQVFYNSKDGTLIPMYLVHKKGLKADGSHPTILYGYGGFNVSLTPSYSTPRSVWLEAGGVIAIPNLRGGGEYGAAWHEAGTKLKKQNVFDDFIAAAKWLVENDIAQAKKIAILGRSNGGLLVGAVMSQEPELFGAALPAVGVMDMLRYHTPSANAKAWSSDFGLSTNEEEFGALHAYSPLHNLAQGQCYPPTLVSTAFLDDRVVPWHSYKFAAELQHVQGCENPTLLRVETRAGHGAGKPKWMIIEDYADQWAFIADHLGLNL